VTELKTLIIEDNQGLATNIGEYLEAHHHIVDFADNGLSGIDRALNDDFDTIVLDINLPGLDGLELCGMLRGNAKHVPVLMISARDTLQNRIDGYSAGCSDYLVKPFSLIELEARLVAMHRLFCHTPHEEVLRVADLVYISGTRTLMRSGEKISLKPTTLKILIELMRSSHRVVSRIELEKTIWNDDPPDSDALRTHIYTIRSSVDKGSKNKLVHTIHGVGYRLAALDEI
jgi:DNA-binding response OmpR family regulator